MHLNKIVLSLHQLKNINQKYLTMKRFTFILALVMSMLSFTNAKAGKLQIRSAESTISYYSNFYTNLAYDGNYNTKFWSSDCPRAGYTFTVYLGTATRIGDIKLYFADGDLPTDGAVIEVNDNGTWTQVGEPLNGVQAKDVVTRNAGGINAKQVRLRFTQTSTVWFQLVEFEVYEYEQLMVSRTISAVADPAEGGVVTVNGAAGAVTAEGDIVLSAVPAYGYEFVCWTLDGEVVSTSAEFVDNTEGDKEYVAKFEKITNIDDWYASIDKPTFSQPGGTHVIAGVEFNGENISGFNYTKGTTSSFKNEAFTVVPGETYSLTLTYELHWGDIALYQIDRDGTEKKYGYYTCQWEANGDPYAILGRNSELMCEEFGIENFADLENFKSGETTYIELPYEITVSENHKHGDLIVVRAMISKESNGAYDKNITEGGCFDILLQVAEPVVEKSYTLAVGESEYATLFLDFNAAIPAEVEAYTVTEVNDGYVTLTQVTGVLPAETGVIVKADEANYTFAYSTDEAADVTGNLLKGTVADKNIEGEAYVLGVVDGEVGLYKAAMTGTSWKNNANKAYLPASAVANKSAEFFGFDWDGTTGISEVKGENGEVKVIFDLTGRKVETISAPGIYIVNGKKVLVK